MQDEELRRLTSSEEVSLEEEYSVHESWISDPTKLTYIICDKQLHSTDLIGSMIGDLNLFIFPEEADINIMIAETDYRRRGIAVECVKFLEEKAASLGVTVLSAKIQTDNVASQNLFLKLGYEKIREVEDFNEIHYIKKI